MSIQLVKLRPKPEAQGPKDVTERYIKATAKNTDSLFKNAELILENEVKQEDRYNIYFTLSHTKIGRRQQFEKLDVIAFDIDGIITEQILAYHEPIEVALGIDFSKCLVIHSGNGIQVIVKLKKAIKEKTWFKEHKKVYKHWCERINESLEATGLPGSADTTVFDASRLLRFPYTQNRKPIWNPHAEDTKVREATLFNGCLEYCGFEFAPKELAEKLVLTETSKQELKSFGTPDASYIMEECLFMKHLLNNQEDVEEPLWYAGLGISANFNDGNEWSHKISNKHPDYTFEECEEKAEQASQFPRTCQDICDRWDGCKECPHYQKVKTPLQLKSADHIATEHCGFTTITEKGKIVRRYGDLRRYFQKQHPYVNIAELKRIMIWKEGYYTHMTDQEITAFAQARFIPESEAFSERREFLQLVKDYNVRPLTWLTDSETTMGLINCSNGVLEVEKGILHEHDPKYAFQYVLPYEFNSTAECPTWDLLLQNICCGDQNKIDLLEEYLGFILLGGKYSPNVALILSGAGNNGKTTFINAIRKVIGKSNCSDISIKELNRGFSAAGLEGKLVNFCEEEPPECFKETGMFKKATGEGTLRVERKFEQGFEMENRAKIIMTYNEVPRLWDTTEGMQRRLMIVPFDMDLAKNPDKKIENLSEKLDSELSGILNRGLRGLKRFQENGFTKLSETSDIVKEMVHDSDPVHYWMDEFLFYTKDEEDRVSIDQLYQEFQDEMEAGKESHKLSKRGFTKRLRDIGRKKGLEIERLSIDKKVVRGIKGVQIMKDEAGVMPHEHY